MKIALAGEGAFGVRHLEALAGIEGVRVVSLAGGEAEATAALAARFAIPHWTTHLDETLALREVEAVILATPTPLHASQAIRCLAAGKAVEVEIPLADNLADAERVVAAAARTGLVAMAGHTRRFNPSHQWIHRQLRDGSLTLHQLEVQTHSCAAATSTRLASHAAGPTICSGTTRPTPSISSTTRPARRPAQPGPSRGRRTPNSASPWTWRSS